jgi:hypothetical protein
MLAAALGLIESEAHHLLDVVRESTRVLLR